MNNPVIVYLADKRNRFDECGWYRFDCLCASLKTVKLFLPPLPIVIFHEDFQQQDKERIWQILPDGVFEQVDFSGQEAYHVNNRPDGRCGAYGYCMMCRFFSGVVQAHPLIAEHTHYMRLDDDNYLVAPVPSAFLEGALKRDYTYSCTYSEPHPSCYAFGCDFLRQHSLPIPSYDVNVPYNNLHVSSLRMWQKPLVQRYIAAVEAVHGCVALGWQDTVIQSMILRGLGPSLGLDVYRDRQISYRHNQQCVHLGPHTKYCRDGKNDQYPWGPPVCLE